MKASNVIALVHFSVDKSSKRTLQTQIQQQIVEHILSGRFPLESRLPATRALADHLDVSRITVTLAYHDLVANDYLHVLGRSGYYVSPTAPFNPHDFDDTPKEHEYDWRKLLPQQRIENEVVARPKDWQNFDFNFVYGQADARLINHHNWRKSAIEALGRRDFDDLILDRYEHDDPMILKYIIENTLPKRGIFAQKEEVLLSVGAQNALWMIAQLLLNPNRSATLENPCYPQLRNIIQQRNCTIHHIEVDDEGLIPELIPKDSNAVFTTASHQCPTSTTMPMERRRALIKKAEQHDFVIIEDDYESETPYFGTAKPALKSLDNAGRVIYIGSFSKSMFPSLRLGFLVAPKKFIEEARALRSLILRHPPSYIQRTVAYFLSLGFYDAQMKRVERIHKKRHTAMLEAIQKYNLTLANTVSNGGSSFWMKTDRRINTQDLAEELYKDKVLIEPGSPFFPSEAPKHNYYRIAYSSVRSSQIDDGIKLISEGIQRKLNKLD